MRNITFLINFIKIMKSIKEKKERKKTNLEILLKDIFTLIKFIKRVDVKIGIKIEICQLTSVRLPGGRAIPT